MEYFYTIIIGYLIGSISPSIIISKYFSGIDIKKHGSGNAGGTNMLRVFGWRIAVPVMLFDIFKSFFLLNIFQQLFFLFQIYQTQKQILFF